MDYSAVRRSIGTYYRLTKPGIIYGNLLTAGAGFLLASRFHIDWRSFAATLAGTSLVIASACVWNNYVDRGIDRKMARTKRRALASGTISAPRAIVYAVTLGALGFTILAWGTNALVVGIGLVAFIDYVVLYGLTKRRTVHGTVVGSVSGSAPLVAGYCAASGHLDFTAWLLFLIMTSWQMPHFYAIAMYRLEDYRKAGLPVLPVRRGIPAARRQIIIYILVFITTNLLLSAYGPTGYMYAAVMTIGGGVWLWRGAHGFRGADDARWARGMFFFSLVVLLTLCVSLAFGALIP